MLLPWMSERRCRVARAPRAAGAAFSRFLLRRLARSRASNPKTEKAKAKRVANPRK
jgi:hypothetical protein